MATEVRAEIRLNSSDHKMGIFLYYLCLPVIKRKKKKKKKGLRRAQFRVKCNFRYHGMFNLTQFALKNQQQHLLTWNEWSKTDYMVQSNICLTEQFRFDVLYVTHGMYKDIWFTIIRQLLVLYTSDTITLPVPVLRSVSTQYSMGVLWRGLSPCLPFECITVKIKKQNLSTVFITHK